MFGRMMMAVNQIAEMFFEVFLIHDSFSRGALDRPFTISVPAARQ